MIASRPSAPRTAMRSPFGAISTCGNGVASAHRTDATIAPAPPQRSGERIRHSITNPALHRSSGPAPNAGTRPTAPGRLATHSAMAFIHSMPMPINFHSASSKPNGMATSPSIPAGMIQAETMGIARRLASTP